MQMSVFPYSVFYIFFEQYLDIWSVALMDIALALGEYPTNLIIPVDFFTLALYLMQL